MDTTPDFTRDGWRELISEIADAGFTFEVFRSDLSAEQRSVLLRHDVDLDLAAAREIAEIEADLGARSTFFFLVSSDLYNPASAEGRSTLRELSRQGHEIGLHFDPSLSGWGEASLFDLQREASWLSYLADRPVSAFSLHKPANQRLDVPASLGLLNAYDPPFLTEGSYVADSMGWWRFGRPTEQAFFREGRLGQIVTHPVWWTSDQPEHPAVRLERLTDERPSAVTASLRATVRPYDAWLAGRHDDWNWSPDLR